MQFIISILLNGLAVFLTANILDGVSVASFVDAVIVGVVLGLINTIVKPIINFFAFPITLFTLGLFALVINGVLVMLADHFLEGFAVSGLVMAIIFSVLLAVLNAFFGIFKK